MNRATPEAAGELSHITTGLQFATFYVDNILLGIGIEHVQEINRQLEVTFVPHAPPFVKGVINLRGDVVTVIDMREVLGLPPCEINDSCRNVIIQYEGELFGLLVDQIGDILSIAPDDVNPAPANVGLVDGRFFQGVCSKDSKIVVILDLVAVVAAEDHPVDVE